MLARLLARLFPATPVVRHRLGVEPLEDRLTPNNRFVVPLPIPADNVTTFHSLATALSTPGLAAGDSVQVEPFSTPGAISNAHLDAINVANVTVRGASDFGPNELPVVRTADAISVDAQEVGLTFQNVNLRIDHTLTFNANGAIRSSSIDVGATGGDGIRFSGTTAAVLEDNTVVNTGVGYSGDVIKVFAGVGGANRVVGNRLSSATTYGTLLGYYSDAGGNTAIGDVVASNTFVGSDSLDQPASMISVASSVNGLTIRKNSFRDPRAVGSVIDLSGSDGIEILENDFDIYNIANAPTALSISHFFGGTSTTGYFYDPASATVIGNSFSTGASGTAITAFNSPYFIGNRVKIEANLFGENRVGVKISGTDGGGGVVDLGGGSLGSAGGNNFRSFSLAATATSGAIVTANGNGPTVQAQNNLFVVADPESVIYDLQDVGGIANVVATGNLTGNAAFVQSLYVQFLHRAGDVLNPNGAGLWVNALNGGATPSAVATAIIRSPEALGSVVDDLYRTILGRDADPVGLSHHINLLANGWTVEAVQIGLLAGAEYRVRFPSDAAYIASLFVSVLGRSPQGGTAFWLNQLPSLGRSGVAAGFVLSTEYRTRQVTHLFFDLLKRTPATAPTAPQVAAWVDTGLDLLSLRVVFASSAEFFIVG